jgi:hypothetical protein
MIFNVAIMVKTEWRMAVACSDLLDGNMSKFLADATN